MNVYGQKDSELLGRKRHFGLAAVEFGDCLKIGWDLIRGELVAEFKRRA